MKGKFTPGPWIFVDDFPKAAFVQDARGFDIARTFSTGQPAGSHEPPLITHTEAEANAMLISAAPDLLASLQEIFGMIERGELVRDISQDGGRNFALYALEFVPKLNRAVIAINKATGGAK